MTKEVLTFIEHILESIRNIEIFMENVSKEHFLKNKEKQNAVIREIEVIGEAVKNISSSFKNKYSNVPWKDIVGTRDKIIHHYFGIDLKIVWDIVKKDLLDLKKNILKIRKDLENSNENE